MNISPSCAMAYTILGIGNIDPNIETVNPANAPTATMYLQLYAPTCPNISTSAESGSTSSYGTEMKKQIKIGRYNLIV